MTLLEDLGSGNAGVRLQLRAGQIVHDLPDQAVIRDAERKVGWLLSAKPFRLDLRPELDAILRADVERHARGLFDRSFVPPEDGALQPRTSDPSWSPVVEVEPLTLPTGRALRMVHRLTYQPGHETVVGRLLVPVERGTLCISSVAKAELTGYRETALMMRASADGGEVDFLPQAAYDAPEHDAQFPDHGLSRVRAALAWLLTADGAGLEVTAPMAPLPPGVVELREASCAVLPPARFVRLPAGTLPMSPSLAAFSRVVLGQDEEPRLLDVWDLRETLPRTDRVQALVALARRTAEGWASEGARDLTVEVAPLPERNQRSELSCTVTFKVANSKIHSCQHWIADIDGRVFRIAEGGESWLPREELQANVAAVAASWRRLEAPASKRRWWPFGSA
jgi:hypothetical protein